MYKVEAIVREEKLEDVKEALVAEDIRGMTISQVMGCGVQMGFTELVRGNEIAVNMIPKIKFEILELQGKLEREVSTVEIGEMVMKRLKEVDEVAYVRFASVYRSFKDINTFMDELSKLLTEQK